MKLLIAAILSFATPFAAHAGADWQKKALSAVKAEKTVLDAKWRMPSQNVLWVAMAGDGSSRDGFAEYLCEVITDTAPAGALKTVWIYDPASYKAGGTAMGTAACK
ncbi:hypothetical protein [Agrobacterium pusense]|uniref:hypothetical protein n=1 Tax=Agrobacterium pusense TaxID=648995 RepID=UPI0010AE57DA|nr:hypothetical protein [Agrobacterium pusense]WCK24643.1 hypothetical protein CFBP5496_0003335 [Agrobacterium pusense]